ncbi:MAG: Mur ligase domain-containing protein, partial [Vulcanimicrobiaceae bacterium]
MRLATAAALAASDARTLAPDAFPLDFELVTDSRTLAPGQVFLALRGERFDGHAFVREALARGAGGLIVADAAVVPSGVGALVVTDTTAALLACARLARDASPARFVAITGSVGKTTTKAFLAQLL